MGIEYELKFKADCQIQQAVLTRWPGKVTEYEMETTYYDTPSGALSDRRITLRRHLENGTSVCTVKTPVSGPGRGEWEVNCDGITEAVPKLISSGAPASALAPASEGLIPICGARFHRTAVLLTLPDCTLELALDRGVLLGGLDEEPLCEIEVELKEGSPADADRFAGDLAEDFGLEREHSSKFRRALALYRGE